MPSVNAQPDITLLLDMDGVIREATVGSGIAEAGLDAWLGRPWADTVADVGNEKIRRMIEDARAGGVSAFRQINQRFPSGLELPFEYTTVALGGRAGLLAIGKSLAAVADLQSKLVSAQQSMERDYWKLREVETRYRLLFQASNEAIILIRATDLTISEANQAAVDALGVDVSRLRDDTGVGFLTLVADEDQRAVEAMLVRVREHGKAPGTLLRLGRQREAWTVRASLVVGEPDAFVMLQLVPIGSPETTMEPVTSFTLDELVERIPDGLVVDEQGVIRRANRAFLDMIGASTEGFVAGERLSRWLWRPGADLGVILAHVRKNGAARLLTTTLQSELGGDTEVEISAAGNFDDDPTFFCLLVRDVGRRMGTIPEGSGLRAALGAVAERVGKTPLRALVQDTVGVLEKHYVRSALDLANGNRTMAADLLGLSRQSLYAKLERYGLELDSRQKVEKSERE